MKKLLFLACIALTGPAWAQNQNGFYLGADLSTFDTDFENLTVTGDGSGIGLHAGYRYAVDDTFFLEGEVFATALDGDTNTGNTEFKRFVGATLGAGAYVTDTLSGLVFVGIANVRSENVTTGRASDAGTVFGLGIGYDLTPAHSIGLRYSK
ncbi:MAG: outer membrane beta-barrel protein, partial [Litoreibacter sp.]|nr:outer membrane beta-barrel protein [Litoreibacter sp.]